MSALTETRELTKLARDQARASAATTDPVFLEASLALASAVTYLAAAIDKLVEEMRL